MWSVASTVLQDPCPNQAAAGTVLSPKRGRSWSLRPGLEELSLYSLDPWIDWGMFLWLPKPSPREGLEGGHSPVSPPDPHSEPRVS